MDEYIFLMQGMQIIESLNPKAFTDYLRKYSNTICGRHPIGVLLQVRHDACVTKSVIFI